MALADITNDGGAGFGPPLQHLAKLARCSPEEATQAIMHLKQRGLLEFGKEWCEDSFFKIACKSNNFLKLSAEEVERRAEAIMLTSKRRRPGYVYLLQSGDLYKIGFSKNVPQRVATISANCSTKTALKHTIICADMVDAEFRLHQQFNARRRNGEWFELSREDVEYICGISEL